MRVTFIRWGRPNGRCQTRNDEISLTRSSRPEWLESCDDKDLKLQRSPKPRIEPKGLFPDLQTLGYDCRNKRTRRTQEEMAAVRLAIKDVLKFDHPRTVRQVFCQLVERGATEKTEKEYQGTIIRLLTELRLDGITTPRRRPTRIFGSIQTVSASCFAELIDVRPVTDPNGLARHALERDAIEAGHVDAWQHSNARGLPREGGTDRVFWPERRPAHRQLSPLSQSTDCGKRSVQHRHEHRSPKDI